MEWTVQDDIWTETGEMSDDGQPVRKHSYGPPYTIKMSKSDAKLYNKAGTGFVVVVLLMAAALLALVIA